MNALARSLRSTALGLIAVHFLLVVLHSAAHEILSVRASPAQLAFIIPVIIVAPIVAGALLRRRGRAGAALLAASMLGSFLFGLFYHFILQTHDHVAHVAHLQPAPWASVFHATAYLLAVTEGLGAVAGALLLHRPQPLGSYAARTDF